MERKLKVLGEVVAEGSSTGLSAHHQEQIVTRGQEAQNAKDLRKAKRELAGPVVSGKRGRKKKRKRRRREMTHRLAGPHGSYNGLHLGLVPANALHDACAEGGGCLKSALYRTLSVRDLYFIFAHIGLYRRVHPHHVGFPGFF